MDSGRHGVGSVVSPIGVCAGIVTASCIVAGCLWAAEGPDGGSDAARSQRIAELERQRDRLQRELRQLKQQPDGVSRSSVPRSELSEQPTRTLKEFMESVPGVAVSPGPGGRAVDLSIRGSGK